MKQDSDPWPRAGTIECGDISPLLDHQVEIEEKHEIRRRPSLDRNGAMNAFDQVREAYSADVEIERQGQGPPEPGLQPAAAQRAPKPPHLMPDLCGDKGTHY